MANEVEDYKHQLMEMQNKLAFQEDAVRALDDALALQQQEILLLRRQVELLKQRQDEQAARHDADEGGSPIDEKPPHY